MTFDDWLRNGWVTKQEPGAGAIREHLAVADRDIAACRTPGLDTDWRLSIAHNAALQLATAALAAAGYRAAKGGSHHYRVIQSLAHTVGAEPSLVLEFEALHKKRNVAGYDRAGAVSDAEADRMRAIAELLRAQVTSWIKTEHPGLL